MSAGDPTPGTERGTGTAPFLLAQAGPAGGAAPASAPAPAPAPAPADAGPPSPFVKTPQATSDQWKALVPLRRVLPPAQAEIADKVQLILLATAAGIALVADLHRLLSRNGQLVSHIRLDYREKTAIPGYAGEAGQFTPARRRAPTYTVYVGWDDSPLGSFYAARPTGIYSSITSGRSLTVATLFHELLHVWFIHAFNDRTAFGPDDKPNTGHTTFTKGRYDKIESAFEGRVRALLKELEAMEQYSARQQRKN